MVVALFVDDEATTVGTIEKDKLRFPVGHSANADEIAALTGHTRPRAIFNRRGFC